MKGIYSCELYASINGEHIRFDLQSDNRNTYRNMDHLEYLGFGYDYYVDSKRSGKAWQSKPCKHIWRNIEKLEMELEDE